MSGGLTAAFQAPAGASLKHLLALRLRLVDTTVALVAGRRLDRLVADAARRRTHLVLELSA